MKNIKKEALLYHSMGKPGKIEVVPTKPFSTQTDLALAYSPGVAEPCLKIEENPEDAYLYTTKGNLVAVISNGTAVLGLGDIGPLAGKPVMEGKGLLFKIYADIDVFDIEVDTKDVDKFVETVKMIAPTFGGINLEDIKAPECFEIENRLKKALDIPVMHDDQHGTAIISAAALLNALEITGRKIEEVKLVVNGAGAAAISCSRLYMSLGVRRENIAMCDSKGVITTRRTDLTKEKIEFASDRNITTLEEAMKEADVFLGLSKGNVVSQDMVRLMAKDPIVFALANPTPEISYEEATAAREDIIFATGRSDYPNQVNNVLGFPYIFRGALDARASEINEEMKVAAVKALAALAKEPAPESVKIAYNVKTLNFGKNYLIPKPLDHRLLAVVSTAVAKAAMESGVARKEITDWDQYAFDLNKRMGRSNELLQKIRHKAKLSHKRIVLSAGAGKEKALKAAQTLYSKGLGIPVILGNKAEINQWAAVNQADLEGIELIDFRHDNAFKQRERYAKLLFEKRQRKGVTYTEALEKMYDKDVFGLMMVESGDADGMVMVYEQDFVESLRPALQIIGTKDDADFVAGMYIVLTKRGPVFFADVSVNISPTEETLVQTTLLVADAVKKYGIEPQIAMLSFSNFGSASADNPSKVAHAVEILHKKYPEINVDGEMQANFALDGNLRLEKFPFNKLGNSQVNTFVFPCLASGNIASMFIQQLGGFEGIGPIMLGLKKPVHLIPSESSVRELVNMAAVAAGEAQTLKE